MDATENRLAVPRESDYQLLPLASMPSVTLSPQSHGWQVFMLCEDSSASLEMTYYLVGMTYYSLGVTIIQPCHADRSGGISSKIEGLLIFLDKLEMTVFIVVTTQLSFP